MYNYIDIHTHKNKNTSVLEIINTNNIINNKYLSIGVHPWDIKINNNNLSFIEYNITNKNIFAVGEIGIDRSININIDIQKSIFLKQLKIAKQVNKPVIIHCVRAYSDFQEIIKQHKHTYIFHDFNANVFIANSLIENGAYLSFGEKLIHNKKLQYTFRQLPINKIFFETDESNVDIKDIYIFASQLLKLNIFELQKVIQNNFKKVFGVDVRKLV